ncbi:beta strand repeat-containing protein, partial [Pseudoalteromonas sp. T1lg88]|uniref:beta strand repeat-containing protein n=1 Tax=Pseudoalteromonas sp. T1lg88 TaxID=2077104 RepID=UPI0018FF1093
TISDGVTTITVPSSAISTDSNGNLTVTGQDLSSLADGELTVTMTVTDAAGNTGTVTDTTTLDTATPSVTINDDVTNDSTPALTGTIDDPEASIVVTVEGVDYTATNNGDGTWTLVDNTLPALMDGSYQVTVTATDAAGNSGMATGNLVIDTSAPTTGDGANSIAFNDGGDELVNASEATNVTLSGVVEADATVDSITISDGVTTITVPSSAITLDSNGNLSITGQDLSSLADGELTVTMTVTDAAGNTGTVTDTTTLDTAVDGNGNGQTVTFDSISNDSGTDGDFITSDTSLIFNGTIDLDDATTLTVSVGGTEYTFGTAPELTIDSNGNWSLDLSGTPLAAGTYPVIATVTDAAGNSLSTASQDVVIQALDAVNDVSAIDLEPVVTVNPPQTTDDVEVLGLADATGGANASATFTVAPDNIGDVEIEVSQTSLAAVADAFMVEVYDENGVLVYQGVSANSQLANVGGLDIFNITGDETISISIPDLAAGNYSVVVRNDASLLENQVGSVLDADGDGEVSLSELGFAGVELGPDNRDYVLQYVEDTINAMQNGGSLLTGDGTLIRETLEEMLAITPTIDAGEIADRLTDALDAKGVNRDLKKFYQVIADALFNDTVTLLESTDITTTVTEYSYFGEAQGNLIEGDTGGAGADTIIDGAQVTVVTNSAGESVVVPDTGTVTIQGAYGVLEIAADGTYTYTANGDRSSFGQDEVFNYTLSDGETSDSASLTISITGSDSPAGQAQTDIATDEGAPVTELSADLLFSMVDDGELMMQYDVLASSEPRFNDKSEELMRQAVLEHTVEEDIELLLNDVDAEPETQALSVSGDYGTFSIDGVMFNDVSLLQQSPWADEDTNVVI